MDMKLEVVVLPVSNVDRSKKFYEGLGFRMDIDYVAGDDFRVVQFTPPGSGCSVTIGTGITDAAPGSARGIHLVVTDIIAARDALISGGADVSEILHDEGGIFHHIGAIARVSGPHPSRGDYGSFASFSDPDGNEWYLQEINTRAPGR